MSKKSHILYLQGFRGLAILLIILFHLCPTICPNGFFGVDAFLVLSGYFLIGKQLKNAQPFSLREFMVKKGLRLFPPMLVVCVCVTLLASLLPEFSMRDILQEVTGALCCIPNMKLAASTNDYFAADTRNMPLMHLWYMGCIIQSYLVFALLFVGWKLCRIKLRGKLISLCIIFLLSLAVRHQSLLHTFGWGGTEYLNSTYYLTTARLWEIIAGGWLVLVPDYTLRAPRMATLLSCVAGIGFCLISFLPIGDGTAYIFIPVVLTGLLIINREHGYFIKLLCSRPLLFIGGISFSLYLVHWPIICVAENFLGISLSFQTALAEMLLIFVAGWGLYLLAEKRVFKALAIIVFYLICWAICLIFQQTGSMRSLFSSTFLDIDTLNYNMVTAEIDKPLEKQTEGLPVQWSRLDGQEPSLIYHIGTTSKEASFVLLGDSHSENIVAGFDLTGQEYGWSGIYLNSYFHPFWGALYEEAGQPKHTFDKIKGDTFMRWFKAHPSLTHVVVSQYWQARMVPHQKWDGATADDVVQSRYEELAEMSDKLASIGKRLILLTDNPHLKGRDPRQYVLSKRLRGENSFDETDYICTKDEYNAQSAVFMQVAERLEKEGRCTIIRMGEALLQDGDFSCMKGNKLMMKDSHHLSYMGGLEVVRLIADDFLKALSEH